MLFVKVLRLSHGRDVITFINTKSHSRGQVRLELGACGPGNEPLAEGRKNAKVVVGIVITDYGYLLILFDRSGK